MTYVAIGGEVPKWNSEDVGERAARAVLGRFQPAWEGWYLLGPSWYDARVALQFDQFPVSLLL